MSGMMAREVKQALEKSEAFLKKAKAWEQFARPGGWVSGWFTGMSLAMAYQGHKQLAYTMGAVATILTVLFFFAASMDFWNINRARKVLKQIRKKYNLD